MFYIQQQGVQNLANCLSQIRWDRSPRLGLPLHDDAAAKGGNAELHHAAW
jgi:hypothetical protein